MYGIQPYNCNELESTEMAAVATGSNKSVLGYGLHYICLIIFLTAAACREKGERRRKKFHCITTHFHKNAQTEW